MGKLLKVLGWIIGALVAVIILAVIVVPMVVDPNDYRDDITRVVKEKTGRTLTIQGEMNLSVFPWLGLEIGELQLSNAAGFGEQPFARIERADISVKLIPLLSKKVEMDTVVLDGLRVNLARDAQGRTNWADLAGEGVPAEAPKEAPQGPARSPGEILGALAIGGVEVRDAQVTWSDAASGASYTLRDVNLTSDAIVSGAPFDLELAFAADSNQPPLTANTRLTTAVLLDLDQDLYRLQDLALTVDASGEGVPSGTATLSVNTDLEANLAAQTLTLADLTVRSSGVEITGNASGTKILEAPTFTGGLTIEEFTPRDTLQQLGIELPPMADPNTLTKASAQLQLRATPERAEVSDLKLVLDDTTVTGSLSAAQFAKPLLRYTVAIDAIDVDRYLPPPSEGETKPAATPAAGAAAGAAQLPVEMLRSLDIEGTFDMGKLKVSNLRTHEIHATLTGKNGLFRLHPVSAKLYEGGYEGDLRFDVKGETPKFSIDEKLTGVQAGPLLTDFVGKPHVTGVAAFNAKLSGAGLAPDAIRRSLNGTAGFDFRDGTVKGINVGLLIRKAYAKVKGLPAPADEPQETDFARMQGTVKATNGVLRNDDLSVQSPLLRINGRGTIDLVQETLDYRLGTSIVGTLRGQGGKDIDELRDVTIPVRIEGSFAEPKFAVDMEELLKSSAKKRIEEEVEKKLEDKLKDGAGGALKKLFKF